jgi:hypothetical protein
MLITVLTLIILYAFSKCPGEGAIIGRGIIKEGDYFSILLNDGGPL